MKVNPAAVIAIYAGAKTANTTIRRNTTVRISSVRLAIVKNLYRVRRRMYELVFDERTRGY